MPKGNLTRSRTRYVLEHELKVARARYEMVRKWLRQSKDIRASKIKTLKDEFVALKEKIDELEKHLAE